MRVLFIVGWYPTKTHPTLGNFVQRHAAALSTLHEVTVLHAAPDPTAHRTEVVSTQIDRITEHIAYFPPGNVPILARRAAWRKLIHAYGRGHDLVHGHVLHASVLPLWMLRGTSTAPLVITEHWTGYLDGRANHLPWPVRWAMRRLARTSACLCPVSDNLGQAMRHAGIAGRYSTVQNVVDTALFRPLPHPGGAPPFRLLHVSTLMDEQKNITGLLRAFREAWEQEPNLVLELISDGDIEPHQAFAHRLGLPSTAISFTGRSAIDHIAERMSMSNALVLFSRRENMPCVIAEAFASGIPVIATDVGGIAEHLTPERGILVPSGDEAAFTSALLRMAHSSAAFHSSVLRAYAEQHFSMGQVAMAYDGVYQQALANG